jgi:hypothetical protein
MLGSLDEPAAIGLEGAGGVDDDDGASAGFEQGGDLVLHDTEHAPDSDVANPPGISRASAYSSPVRNCARPFPKLQSSAELMTKETTTSLEAMPQLTLNCSQSSA